MKDWDKAGEEIEALDEGFSGSEGEEVGEWWFGDNTSFLYSLIQTPQQSWL